MKHAIPDDWDKETFCRFSVCWPDSPLWRAILRGLLTEPARGYFWDERTGYIKGVLADFRQTMDYNLLLECVIMSCQDATALIEALNTNFATLNQTIQALQLAVTVEPASPTITVEPANPTITVEPASPDITLTCSPDVNVTCGGGGFGPGGPSSPGYGPYGQGPVDQPPANPGQTIPGPGPGGYQPPASWGGTSTEYDEYKCKASYFIVDGYINYVDGWARNLENIASLHFITTWAWSIFEGTPWVLLLSPNLIPMIIWYLATVEVGLLVEENLLDEYLDYLRGVRDEWACDFYNATSIEAARTVCQDYVGGGGVVAWPTAIRDFHIDVMFKNYVLNILFEEYGPAASYAELVDCSGCIEGLWHIPFGTIKTVVGGVASGQYIPNTVESFTIGALYYPQQSGAIYDLVHIVAPAIDMNVNIEMTLSYSPPYRPANGYNDYEYTQAGQSPTVGEGMIFASGVCVEAESEIFVRGEDGYGYDVTITLNQPC